MKVLKEEKVVEQLISDEENEGLVSLIGQQVMILCNCYIYTGRLVGVNKEDIKLESPKIVYETGAWDKTSMDDAQAIPSPCYIKIGHIESYHITNKK